ncbi:hypothetical protein LCGC14_0524400 [marine sediment metagenome]|uniref:Uncharacterized protein n=1 Tax=marine sediment metagenome TaxID=412755 RepID=A0A0F9S286_9ZZZZ
MRKRKIKEYSELNFENEDNTLNSLNVIKSEYITKWIKRIIVPITITAILIITGMLIEFLNPHQDPPYLTRTLASFDLDSIERFNSLSRLNQLTVLFSAFYWILFSSCIFLSFHFVKSTRQKYTPSLTKFFKRELNDLGFEIHKIRNSYKIFIILNGTSLIFLISIITGLIVFDLTIKILLIIYLGLSLTIPILWIIVFDRYIIDLNDKYYIQLHTHYSIKRIKKKEKLPIWIYITSNRIALKSDQEKKKIFSQISEKRWLPRKRNYPFFTNYLNPFLQFHEFTTLLNFQKQFLNIVLAIHDWDLIQKNS